MNLDERKIVDVNDLIDKPNGDGIAADSDIMKALEDIDYDIEQLENMGEALDANGIDSPDFLNDRNSELEQSLDLFKNPQKMEKILSSEGISPDDPVRMYLKVIAFGSVSVQKANFILFSCRSKHKTTSFQNRV